MGKRSDFAREPRDLYRTWDARAAAVLASYLGPKPVRYIEPCAGAGDLIRTLGRWGHKCLAASDIEPLAPGIQRGDALRLRKPAVPFDFIITNPPWDRALLHPLIVHFMRMAPTILLFDADWMHTAQAVPLLRHCRAIASVGRLRWIEGSSADGKDNCCWYHFDAAWRAGPKFIARPAELLLEPSARTPLRQPGEKPNRGGPSG